MKSYLSKLPKDIQDFLNKQTDCKVKIFNDLSILITFQGDETFFPNILGKANEDLREHFRDHFNS